MSSQSLVVRAPWPCESVLVQGPALAEALYSAVIGNEDFDCYGLRACIERIKASEAPYAAHAAQWLTLFGPDGPLPQGLEWCLLDTRVAIHVPPVEGVLAYFEHQVRNLCVPVSRGGIELIEDPWSSFLPSDMGGLLEKLGIGVTSG